MRSNGHFTVTCKILGDNLVGVPTNFGNDCSLVLLHTSLVYSYTQVYSSYTLV